VSKPGQAHAGAGELVQCPAGCYRLVILPGASGAAVTRVLLQAARLEAEAAASDPFEAEAEAEAEK
jgi:hypothetical protein